MLDAIYAELRRIARGLMRHEADSHTLQPTALVHEALIRILNIAHVDLGDQRRLVALAALQMRRVLVDHARRRQTFRRHGEHVPLDAERGPGESSNVQEVIEVDRLLHRMREIDGRAAAVTELLYFGGLSVPETAAVLDVSEATVRQDWLWARAWMQAELSVPRGTAGGH